MNAVLTVKILETHKGPKGVWREDLLSSVKYSVLNWVLMVKSRDLE